MSLPLLDGNLQTGTNSKTSTFTTLPFVYTPTLTTGTLIFDIHMNSSTLTSISTISDGSGTSYKRRSRTVYAFDQTSDFILASTGPAGYLIAERWYASIPSTSGVTAAITVTLNAGIANNINYVLHPWTNSSASSTPWDTFSGLPGTNGDPGLGTNNPFETIPNVTYTDNNPPGIVLATFVTSSIGSPATPAGFTPLTQISNFGGDYPLSSGIMYGPVSSIQSNVNITWVQPLDSWLATADVLSGSSLLPSSTTQSLAQILVG